MCAGRERSKTRNPHRGPELSAEVIKGSGHLAIAPGTSPAWGWSVSSTHQSQHPSALEAWRKAMSTGLGQQRPWWGCG